MRLINTITLKLEEYFGNRVPKYAILSHTWEEEEVSFQEFQSSAPAIKVKKGYRKIQKFCEVASGSGFVYGWVDTCCIDKSSSHELSEAINSMFTWYEKSEICYAYLADFDLAVSSTSPSDQIMKSRWFRRGWTLQELLAPAGMMFFDTNWNVIDSRKRLAKIVSTATGISQEIISGTKSFRDSSVAAKMSWASMRETTREEDTAYCLLGIFGIFMPLLYGEGKRAFIRLQEEIMKVSMDHSLFAWITPHDELNTDDNTKDSLMFRGTGILAQSPKAFLSSGDIENRLNDSTMSHYPFSLTNNGCINIRLKMSPGNPSRDQDSQIYGNVQLAWLNCTKPTSGEYVGGWSSICMYVRKSSNDTYRRVLSHHLSAAYLKQSNDAWDEMEISLQAFHPSGTFLQAINMERRRPQNGIWKVFAPDLLLLLKGEMPFLTQDAQTLDTIDSKPEGVFLVGVYPTELYGVFNDERFDGAFELPQTASYSGMSMGFQFLLTKEPLYVRFNVLFGIDRWDIAWSKCTITKADTTLEQIFQGRTRWYHYSFLENDWRDVKLHGDRLQFSIMLERQNWKDNEKDTQFSSNRTAAWKEYRSQQTDRTDWLGLRIDLSTWE